MAIERLYVCNGKNPECEKPSEETGMPQKDFCGYEGGPCKHTSSRKYALYDAPRRWRHVWHMESMNRNVYFEEER